MVAFALVASTGLGSADGRASAEPAAPAGPGRAAPELPGAAGPEVLDRRTRTSRTYRTDEGDFQTISALGSVNYRDPAGAWQPIDNRLVARPGGEGFENRANRYRLGLSADAAAPVRVTEAGAFVEFALVGARGRPVAREDRVVYPDALPSTDLAYEAASDVVKETLTLAGPSAPRRFTYAIATSAGLRVVAGGNGTLEVLDAAGRIAFSVEAPFMTDAAGALSRDLAVRLSPDGARLTVTPDAAWLASPARAYPVVIDPTITPGASPDCTIQSGASSSTSFCGDTTLQVGRDASGIERRALAKFDVSAIPARSTVLTADVKLYTTAASGSATISAELRKLTRDFSTGASWNNYNGKDAWTTPGGDFAAGPEHTTQMSGSLGFQDWYPTAAVQRIVEGTEPNRGFVIAPSAASPANVLTFASSEHPDSSKRPYMVTIFQPWLAERGTTTAEDYALGDRTQLSVNVANGNLIVRQRDLAIAGTGVDLQINHVFNSLSPYYDPPHGNKWVVDTGDKVYLYGAGNSRVYVAPGNERLPFLPNGSGGYVTPPGLDASLVKNSDSSFTLTFNKTGIKQQFNPSGKLTAQQDQNGNEIAFAYNANGTTSTITDTQGRAVSFAYNAQGRLQSMTDASGRAPSWGYSSGGDLTTATDADGKQTSFTMVGPDTNIGRITDPRGKATKLAYDSASRVTAITRVTNTSADTGPTTTYDYAASTTGCPTASAGATSSTDANGKTTRYCYDPMGRVTKTFDARGNARSSTYTANSNVDSATSGGGGMTTSTYDALNNLTGTTGPDGATTSLAYADAGHPYYPTRRTGASGNASSFRYSAAGNLCSVSAGTTAPSSCTATVPNQTRLSHNADGTVATSTDPNGNVTSYGYDAQGNLTSVDNPAPLGDESLGYDGLSRLTSRTDGKGQTTSYAYDPLDRLTLTTYQGGATVASGYDANGNPTSRVDSTGTSTFGYDNLNRLTSESLPGGRSIAYTHDPVGNLASVADAGGTVSYAYDNANNLASLTEPGGHQTTFTNDSDDRRTATVFPNGVSETRTFSADRLTGITATRGTTTLEDFRYCYRDPASGCDAAPQTGTPTEQIRRAKELTAGNTTAYGYDALERLTGATVTGTNPASYAYAYDAAGNRTSQSVNGVGTTYA